MLKFCSSARASIQSLLLGGLAVGAAAASPAAMALSISGQPYALVVAGEAYGFKPTATDSSGRTMVFHIANKPPWAAFNSSTGQLSGTPAAVGTYYNISISVSDGTSTANLPPFLIQVDAADKSPPVIYGVPAASVTAGSTYRFQPVANNPSGNAMWFRIYNKPSWATFSIGTGLLTGTPTSAQAGTYSNISIHATDGQMSASTSAFSITVKTGTPITNSGTATLSWTAPTENTDGTALTDLAGYRLYYGTSPSSLSTAVQLADASVNTYTINNLTAATWYFAIRAYTATGLESAISQIVSKSVN